MVKLESLKKSNQFQKALKEKKIHSKYFSIFAAKNFYKPRYKDNLLISFVMKKKIGNAVKRNKIKRRLRNIINDAVKTINMDLNYSYLFIAKKNLYNGNYKMIKESILKDLTKVR